MKTIINIVGFLICLCVMLGIVVTGIEAMQYIAARQNI